jgi:peptide deformylase
MRTLHHANGGSVPIAGVSVPTTAQERFAEVAKEMVPFHILQWPHPKLSERADSVTPEDIASDEFAYNVRRLTLTLIKKGGFGLSATQVGWMKRVSVMVHPNALTELESREDGAVGQWQLEVVGLINPKVVRVRGARVSKPEGCLSFVGGGGEPVPAYEDIDIECPDTGRVDLMPLHVGTFRYVGLAARVASHEIDHLNGEVFLARMSRLQRKIFLQKLKAEQKKAGRAVS